MCTTQAVAWRVNNKPVNYGLVLFNHFGEWSHVRVTAKGGTNRLSVHSAATTHEVPSYSTRPCICKTAMPSSTASANYMGEYISIPPCVAKQRLLHLVLQQVKFAGCILMLLEATMIRKFSVSISDTQEVVDRFINRESIDLRAGGAGRKR